MVENFCSSMTFVILILCLAFSHDALLSQGTNLPLPLSSKRQSTVPREEWQTWTYISLAAFSVVRLIASLVAGRVGDGLRTRREPLFAGLVLSGAATLFFLFGSLFAVIIGARILEGISSALISTFGYALLADLFHGQQVGKAVGFASMAQILGLLSGLMIRSSTYEGNKHFEAFLPSLILVILVLPMSLMVKEHRTEGKNAMAVSRSNPPTPIFISNRPGSIDEDYYQGSNHAEASNSRRHPSDDAEGTPLLPKPAFQSPSISYLLLLHSPRLITGSIAVSLLTGIQYGIIWVLPPQISSAFHIAPLPTAALFLVMALPIFLAPISGTFADRFGAKWPVVSGLIILTLTLILLGLFGPETSMPLSKLAILMFLLGVSFMLSIPPLRAEAAKVVDEHEESFPGAFQTKRAYASAFGMMDAFVVVGVLAGPLYMHFVRNWLGWCFTSISLGFVSLAMLVPVFWFFGNESTAFEGPRIEVTQES